MTRTKFAVFNDITQNRATIVAVEEAADAFAVALEHGQCGFAKEHDQFGDALTPGERVWLCDIVEVSVNEVSSWV